MHRIVLRAFKIELDLNNKQKTAYVKHAGAARFACNWGLALRQAASANGEKSPSTIDLHRELNALKKSTFPWMYEVSKCAPQEALRDLDAAINLKQLLHLSNRLPLYGAAESSAGSHACGEQVRWRPAPQRSLKQESNINFGERLQGGCKKRSPFAV